AVGTSVPAGTLVATFTDSHGNLAGDFTATINWGDGVSSRGTVTFNGGVIEVLGPAGGHTYARACTCAASVTIADDAPGTATAAAVGRVNVVRVASTIHLVSSANPAVRGLAVIFTVTV